MIRLNCSSAKFPLILSCFFEGVVDDICCFWVWAQICYQHFPKRQQNRTKRVPGEAQNQSSGVAPRGSEKQVPNKTRRSRKTSSKRSQNGANIWIIRICRVIRFDVFLHHLMKFYVFNRFGIIIGIIFMTVSDLFEDCFETSWFVNALS